MLATAVTFNPGETSKPLAVAVTGDALFELDETFQVTLSDPTSATIARQQAQGTIRNDDLAGAALPDCGSRPSPQFSTVQVGPGRLQVTVTAANTPAFPGNSLRVLQFEAADNATVEVTGIPDGQPGGPPGTTSPFTHQLPDGTQLATFVVQRTAAGPFRIDYRVVDICGDFRRFAGGGSGTP